MYSDWIENSQGQILADQNENEFITGTKDAAAIYLGKKKLIDFNGIFSSFFNIAEKGKAFWQSIFSRFARLNNKKSVTYSKTCFHGVENDPYERLEQAKAWGLKQTGI